MRFDPTDSNGDGIPDSVVPNTPPGFEVIVLFDAALPQGELGILVVDPLAPLSTLPEDNLMTINFSVLPGSLGTADVQFSAALPPEAADTQGSRFALDEVADGSVSIAP